MRRFIVALVIVGLVLALASPLYANDPMRKLGRGITNVVSAPYGLVKGIGDAADEKGIVAAATWGVFRGVVNVVKRTVVGVYEVATFPLPIPAGYKPILENPEFFMEKEKFSEWD